MQKVAAQRAKHGSRPCKWGAECNRPNCTYSHPPERGEVGGNMADGYSSGEMNYSSGGGGGYDGGGGGGGYGGYGGG